MNGISIHRARPESDAGGRLNELALGHVAGILAGSGSDTVIHSTFHELWRDSNNRFSHRFAYEAKADGRTLGVVTCYPVPQLNSLAGPTFRKLLNIRKCGLIGHAIMNPADILSVLFLKEGQRNEFHIGTLAMLPESRGHGVGSRLLCYAERLAISQDYARISLTVNQRNYLAIKLYERLGFRKTGEVKRPSLWLYRMSKLLSYSVMPI